jgi:nitroimidazol reductase NimA-like FMN-containing flavoprotein (pyridoxamine 5'-phosphate oxidase superfamily)
MSKEEFRKTPRNQVRRLAKRGKYDKDTVYRILDEAALCHLSFVVDEQPFVIPTLFARIDDVIYVHGSQISRMLKTLAQGVRLCLTVTLVDGLVLARSAFHHSMNYRSAVVFGTGKLVESDEEKLRALNAISDHLLPERWEDCRQPNIKELNVTSVIRIEIEEASAKIREGMPVDDKEDYELPVWAGILPIKQSFGEPIPDEQLSADILLPDYLKSDS